MLPMAVPVSRLCGAVLAVVTLAGAPLAAMDKTPVEWLHAMDSAWRNLDYDGVFSLYTASHSQIRFSQRRGDQSIVFNADVSRDQEVATFRIVHKVVDGVERERIANLSGPRREILRAGTDLSYVYEAGDEFIGTEDAVSGGSYGRLFMRSLDLGANYRVGMSGSSQVLGRPTVVIEVLPLDGDRYGLLLWLDEATGLLLRAEVSDKDGTHLQRVEFERLQLGSGVTLAALEPETTGVVLLKPPEQADMPRSPEAELGWSIGWVPTGFRMADSRALDSGKGVHFMFNDGLATFSVFVETVTESGARGFESRSGATVVSSHSLPGEQDRYLVTVVGEVPPATARRIAMSVQREP